MPRRQLRPRRADRQQTTRTAKARTAKIAGTALIIGVATVFVGIFVYKHLNPNIPIDTATNCPMTGPMSYTAIIIDTTDSVSAILRIAIENEFAKVKAQIPKFGALAIYAAGFEGEISKPEFALCNPGDTSQMDWRTQGKILVKRRWEEGFQKPLDRVLQKMLSSTETSKTPLLEAIQSVSVQSFGPLRSSDKNEIPKRLIIVSDMLQNSEHLNVYKQLPPAQQFLKTNAYKSIRSDLRDVEVSIFFIRRQTSRDIQGSKLLRFWEELFAVQGGRLVRFKPLEG